MTPARTLALSVSGLTLFASSVYGQDLSRYREFTLGSTLATVAQTSGVAPGAAKLIHQRPAVIQELRWRPQNDDRATAPTDPVREVVFSFYDDKLYLIVVDYERQRIEGLTDTDLIESMRASYGPPVLTSTGLRPGAPPPEPEGDTVVARWAGTESSLTLLRGTYPTSLRLVVALKPVEALARTASAEAIRMDLQEAPQREVDRQKQVVENSRLAREKARGVNRPAFKP
jgi:hypothetical protein